MHFAVEPGFFLSDECYNCAYQSCQYDFCFLLQYVSEKIGGAKGTELDDEFTEMERVSNLNIIDL